MTKEFSFDSNCKYAILAVCNARVDIPPLLTLQDGANVLSGSFPFQLGDHWRNWLGTIQFDNLQTCNLFLVCTATDGWPGGQLALSGDEVSRRLQHEVGSLFAMLRILGTIEYENAFMLAGYVQGGKPKCMHFSQTERFNVTRGYLPWTIKEGDLRTAADLYVAQSVLQKKFADTKRWRFGRGCNCLKTGLEQYYASDRLHGFVRALEALILPEVGNTERQFVSRCALFAGPKDVEATIRPMLQETYKMRSDIEHIHDWDRSLQSYPEERREDIALWRTRQMEALACAAYKKILLDPDLQSHFANDAALAPFWQKPEGEIREAFGDICDITELKVVKKYDNDGRAAYSEWPTGWIDKLQPKAKSAG